MRSKVLEWWILWLVLMVVYCGFLDHVFAIPYWMSASALVVFTLSSFRVATASLLAWQAREFERRTSKVKEGTPDES